VLRGRAFFALSARPRIVMVLSPAASKLRITLAIVAFIASCPICPFSICAGSGLTFLSVSRLFCFYYFSGSAAG